MAVGDSAADVRTRVLPPFPQLVEPHTPLTSYSACITTLYELTKKSSTRTELLSELVGIDGQCDARLSTLYPLLLHSLLRLHCGELQLVQQLWTAVRNIVTVRAIQCCFVDSAPFRCLLSSLSALCSSAAATHCSLLELGCQVVANTTANNGVTQSAFLRRHLLSSDFLAIVRWCPSSCLSSLLYILHTVLPSHAEQSFALDSPGGAALLADLTVRLSRQQLRQVQHDDDDESDVDSVLLFPSLAHRLFVHHSSFLLLVWDELQQQHPAERDSVMTFLLSSLLTLSPCALEPDSASYCASSNCLSLLSLLLARYPIDSSERVEDEDSQYAHLPQTLLVDEWTHSCILLVEHVTSSCLTLSSTSVPSLPLLHRLLADDVWYMLISLLSSSNTPALTPSHSLSPSSAAVTPSSSSRFPVPFCFQSDLLRLLSLLSCYPASHPPPYPRLTALSFLGHTAIHPEQPMQREYSIVGIRGLCRWEEARQTLSSMEAQAVDGAEEWRRQGVQLTLDEQSHKVRLSGGPQREYEEVERAVGPTQRRQSQQVEHAVDETDMWSVERMAAVRSAGRRVDWGDSGDDPFDDDFM